MWKTKLNLIYGFHKFLITAKIATTKKNTDTKATIKKLENVTLKLFDLDVQRLNQGLSKKRPEIWIGYFSTDEYFQ